jgi:hypothetical protein
MRVWLINGLELNTVVSVDDWMLVDIWISSRRSKSSLHASSAGSMHHSRQQCMCCSSWDPQPHFWCISRLGGFQSSLLRQSLKLHERNPEWNPPAQSCSIGWHSQAAYSCSSWPTPHTQESMARSQVSLYVYDLLCIDKVETPYHDNDLTLTPIISPQSGWQWTWSCP